MIDDYRTKLFNYINKHAPYNAYLQRNYSGGKTINPPAEIPKLPPIPKPPYLPFEEHLEPQQLEGFYCEDTLGP